MAAGDFDGDQVDDLAIGANKEDHSGKTAPGRVTVIYGSNGGGLNVNDSATFTQETFGVSNSAENNDRFGETLAVGNFDGDNYDDLVVGVPYEDWGGDNSGLIHVLFGSNGGLMGNRQPNLYTERGRRHAGAKRLLRLGPGGRQTLTTADTRSDLAVSAPWEGFRQQGTGPLSVR